VTCEVCGQEREACECPRNAAGEVCLPRDQAARVRREKRRGKWTTVIAGLDPVASDLKGMLKEYRCALGTGGSIAGPKDAPELELQGDHKEKVIEDLRGRGYPAKGAGG